MKSVETNCHPLSTAVAARRLARQRLLLLLGLIIAGSNLGHSQTARTVRLHTPLKGDVLAWGQDAPTLLIQSAVEEGGKPVAAARLFHTAVVLSGQQVVDRVPLFDDGSHSDARANDGVYTAAYRPPQPQSYTLKVRATLEGWEGWSPPVTFHVERVPFPHIVYPEPGGRVGRKVTLRARLLEGDQPFTQDDPSLQLNVRVVNEQGAEADVEASAARRRGSLLTSPLTFSHLGRHEVRVAVSVERRGKRIVAEGVPVVVDVAKPPVALLYAAGVLLLLAALLPPKSSVPLYRHVLSVRNTHTDQQQDIAIEPSGLQPVKRTVGGGGSDFVLEGASGTLCTLTAEPGNRQLTVEAGEGKQLSIGGGSQSRTTVQPNPHGAAFRIGDFAFRYADAKIVDNYRYRRWHPTRAKVLALLCSIVAGALGWWQYTQFFQQ